MFKILKGINCSADVYIIYSIFGARSAALFKTKKHVSLNKIVTFKNKLKLSAAIVMKSPKIKRQIVNKDTNLIMLTNRCKKYQSK
jgi:hypothetical protein